LYVIDNKSSDNSLKETDRLSRIVDFKTIILPQPENGGVAKGNNIGIKTALKDGCDYVLLSNNDIVLEKDTIETLLNGMLIHKATMAVPKIYYWNTDKIIWMAGGDFIWAKGYTSQRGCKEVDSGKYDEDAPIGYAPTCFMLIKSDTFSKVGLMDEKYFVYLDDTDFVWRATKKNAEKLFFIKDSTLYHKVSFSTGGGLSDFGLRYISRNRVYFCLKNFTILHIMVVFSYLLFRYLLKDIWVFNNKRANLIFNSYLEGVKLYYRQ